MEKLPGKGMVTASSLIMLIWGLVNAGYYDIAKLVLADEPSTKAVVCGVVAGIASLAAIIGGIFGIAGSNKVAKASAIVVWAAFLVILAIISGIHAYRKTIELVPLPILSHGCHSNLIPSYNKVVERVHEII